uniref:Putative secreted protein n=1 Tax=Anopheles triannulatus TaxID=58253 RepID=A0A2M4B5U5_9DIPT
MCLVVVVVGWQGGADCAQPISLPVANHKPVITWATAGTDRCDGTTESCAISLALEWHLESATIECDRAAREMIITIVTRFLFGRHCKLLT